MNGKSPVVGCTSVVQSTLPTGRHSVTGMAVGFSVAVPRVGDLVDLLDCFHLQSSYMCKDCGDRAVA